MVSFDTNFFVNEKKAFNYSRTSSKMEEGCFEQPEGLDHWKLLSMKGYTEYCLASEWLLVATQSLIVSSLNNNFFENSC
jgi:hypothetical protein